MQLTIPHTTKILDHEVLQNGESVTMMIHDTKITVTSQHNDNGTTTFRISNLIHWFCIGVADVEEMLAKFHRQHNWEQDPK